MPSPMTTEEALAIIDGYTALSPDMARVRDHLVSLSDPGTLTTAYMAGAENARSEMQAEIDRLRAEVAEARDGWRMANGTADLAMKHRDEAEARAERLAEALRERRDWFEAQAKSISKGNGSSWDLMQVREQRDLCDAALEQEAGRG